MAYLYSGLAIALIIPLVGMVQALTSLAALQGGAAASSGERRELVAFGLSELVAGLQQAKKRGDLEAGSANLNGDLRCRDLHNKDHVFSDELRAPEWLENHWYPNCVVVMQKNNSPRMLRVEMGIQVDQESVNKGLPLPNDNFSQALRVRRSCWVTVASQQEECLSDD